uniref:Uncharacterized protein n=1 Tax=Glossina palpalis gambiensis TaxID=67801 RepID=A0A1B0BM48_9MUSC
MQEIVFILSKPAACFESRYLGFMLLCDSVTIVATIVLHNSFRLLHVMFRNSYHNFSSLSSNWLEFITTYIKKSSRIGKNVVHSLLYAVAGTSEKTAERLHFGQLVVCRNGDSISPLIGIAMKLLARASGLFLVILEAHQCIHQFAKS